MHQPVGHGLRRDASSGCEDYDPNPRGIVAGIWIMWVDGISIVCLFVIKQISCIYLHLFIPTLELPANQGSMTKTHLNVVASCSPRNNEGLSCSRNPLRNQCTKCFSWITAWVELAWDCPRMFWGLLCVLDDVATSPEVALSNFSPVIMWWEVISLLGF